MSRITCGTVVSYPHQQEGWPRLFQPGEREFGSGPHHSVGKASAGFFEHGASNLARDYDKQMRVSHVLKNMGRPAADRRLGAAEATWDTGIVVGVHAGIGRTVAGVI